VTIANGKLLLLFVPSCLAAASKYNLPSHPLLPDIMEKPEEEIGGVLTAILSTDVMKVRTNSVV